MLYLSFSKQELFTESNNGSIIEKDHSFSLFKVFVVGLSPSTYTFPKLYPSPREKFEDENFGTRMKLYSFDFES